jgi:hypothetical protein
VAGARNAVFDDNRAAAEIVKQVVGEALKANLAPVCDPTDPAAKQFPVLWYWATERTWNGIEPRELPFLSIQASTDGWRVSIADSNLARRYSVVVQRLGDWMQALDLVLRNSDSPYTELKKGKGADKLRNQRKKDLEKLSGLS